MSQIHYRRPHKSLVKGRDCDCCEWCENGKKNPHTLYLVERVGYDILLLSAVNVSLALMLVTHASRYLAYLYVLLKSEYVLERSNLQLGLSCIMTLMHAELIMGFERHTEKCSFHLKSWMVFTVFLHCL